MSRWLELHNQIKRRSSELWMTPTQREVLAQLEQWLDYPGHCNLYGGVGVGKTYLAWILSRNLPAEHVIVPQRMSPTTQPIPNLIIDNASYTEQDIRNILKQCDFCAAEKVVIITRYASTLRMRRIELPPPTQDELREVERHLTKFGFQEYAVPAGSNFWQVLNSFV
ncbi:MAG: hypothetical protein ACOYLB_17695 [Phototrophicaceae bacterium]